MNGQRMVVVALLVLGMVSAAAEARWVGSVRKDGAGGAYTSIQGAIDAAAAANTWEFTITIEDSGTYAENIDIAGINSGGQDSYIIGAAGQRPTIDGSGGAIAIKASDPLGWGLGIENVNIIAGSQCAISSTKDDKLRVMIDNVIIDNGDVEGLHGYGAKSTLNDVTFLGSGSGTGIYGWEDSASGGPEGTYSTNIVITDTTFVNQAKGINLDYCNWDTADVGTSVDNSLFVDCGTALEITDESGWGGVNYDVTVSNCNFHNNTSNIVTDGVGTVTESGTTTENPGLDYSDIDDLTFSLRDPLLGYGDASNWSYVPEPATMSLLALGAVGVLLRRKRR